jgi:hypothetical protein
VSLASLGSLASRGEHAQRAGDDDATLTGPRRDQGATASRPYLPRCGRACSGTLLATKVVVLMQ